MTALALLIALAVDRWWGEPPVRLHPVVWMGNYLGWAGNWVQQRARQDDAPDYTAFWLGALAWCAGAAMVLIVAVALQVGVLAVLHAVPSWVGGVLAVVLLGLLLKPLLAWAMLKSEVLAVEQALAPAQGGSLGAGRARLAWLVSRDVTELTEAQVRESAIESLAENLNDSVVAPIFWFVLLGLPGAALYRFANTADAMWGYRGVYQGQRWEWAGKWAARVDDALSWLPARITGLLLVLAAGVLPLARLRTEARRTPSPNSGWPMAAMALALDVCLHKPGVYALNAAGRGPGAQDTQQAVFYASKVLLILVGLAQAAIILIAIGGRL
jgi:adenosylcobinamide-phosphate synthase